jgi:hypothetical protein
VQKLCLGAVCQLQHRQFLQHHTTLRKAVISYWMVYSLLLVLHVVLLAGQEGSGCAHAGELALLHVAIICCTIACVYVLRSDT